MKSISLVSVHRTLNYGTMLQLYASKRIFEDRGLAFRLVDYYRDTDYAPSDFASWGAFCKKRLFLLAKASFAKRLLLLAKSLLSYGDTKRFFSICSAFLESNFDMTPPCRSFADLEKDPPQSECLCAGSDQIWNPVYNGGMDRTFFLGFGDRKCRRISFASSIGLEDIEENDKNLFQSFLSDFHAISVREESAQRFLASVGIPSTALIDPTLQLSAEEWNKCCPPPIVQSPYLLIYKLKGDSRLDAIAHAVARRKGLPVVRITFSKHVRHRGEKCLPLPAIPEFLSLFKHASHIVTNSFHGTCFSVNFARQFTVVPRTRFNTRMENILSKLQLESRMCPSTAEVDRQCGAIDYEEVGTCLSRERMKAKAWLDSALQGLIPLPDENRMP